MSCKVEPLYFSEIKDPVDVDRYGASYSSSWLGQETIQTVSFVPQTGSDIIITDEVIDGNTVDALFSGGNVGTWDIDITITTQTRTKNRRIKLCIRDK